MDGAGPSGGASPPAQPARGGRPTRDASARLKERILDVATEAFLRDGYARTSMEQVASAAGVSKRTLYARFDDKAVLLRAVVERLIEGWLPAFEDGLTASPDLETALLNAGRRMLDVALAPEALALHRLMVSEAARFPELVRVLHDAGGDLGIRRVATLLIQHGVVGDPAWTAEQFQRLVLAGPQTRAMGFGRPLDPVAREAWVRRSVTLFLHGASARAA